MNQQIPSVMGTVPLETTFQIMVSAVRVFSDQRYPSGDLTEALYNMAAHASNPSTQEDPGGFIENLGPSCSTE